MVPMSKTCLFAGKWNEMISTIACPLSISTAVLLAAVSILCASSSAQAELTALQSVVQSELRFSRDLYEMFSVEPGNVFYSPLSIHSLLGMALFGARGSTASQMRHGLNLRGDDQALKDGFRELTALMQSSDAYILETANKIYVENEVQLESTYKTLVQTYFASSVEPVDFAHDAEGSRIAVNAWVANKTRGKIVDVVKEGTFNEDTRFVLVSAIYFNGSWAKAFKANQTRPEPFFVAPGNSRDVPMMHQTNYFKFVESEEFDCKFLELPYKGSNLSMLVALPKKTDGIAQLDAKLAKTSLSGWTALMNSLRQVKVDVALPKFTMRESYNLATLLKKRGMVDMFTAPNFSGMTSGTPVSIGAALHEAFVEVNEVGTEAAAVTVVSVVAASAMGSFETIYEFKANHPFVFVIRDSSSNAVLFGGRLSSV